MPQIHRSLSLLSLLPLVLHATAAPIVPSPDRESFAKNNPTREGVPVEAFQFDESLPKDLQIEVWATTPQIYTPVAMDVDAHGRVWATEGLDYGQKPRVAAGQSIIVLEDKDGDGKADSSHVFVTEKEMRRAPLGIAVFDNKIVLSATPSIIVYTDVNRNAVFDPGIDTREVFLTGFNGGNHDHTLHAVIGAPSGQWYFSHGNMGLDVKTKDGRQYIAGCYYGSSDLIGRKSSDGHLYVPGMVFRVNPDGTGLTPVGENMRNPHDSFVSSLGDVFQSDNDDPANCRVTWLMEYGNLGYADIEDGSRSWEEIAKTWEEPTGVKNVERRSTTSHWRENYPGTMPPGNVYGIGSPTGNVLIEGTELGDEFSGMYLVCDMVLKQIMACRPQAKDAQVEIGKLLPFLSLKKDQQGQFFLPTDLALLPDGSLLLADFYNDTSRRTNQVSGTIYRISRRGVKLPAPAKIDFESVDGLMAALRSPVVNVRSHAAALLKTHGDAATDALIKFFETEKNPYLQARAVWPLAFAAPRGREWVVKQLDSKVEAQRIVAYRALRLADPDGLLARASKMAADPSAAVRREVALSLRDVPFEECRDVLAALIQGFDGHNRWYVEALGTASVGKEAEVYAQLVRPAVAATPSADWPGTALNLAWRLNSPQASADLLAWIKAKKPGLETFRHYVVAFACFRTEDERTTRFDALTALLEEPAFAGEDYQTTLNEILARDLTVLKGEILTSSFQMPANFGEKTQVSDIATIAKLPGDAVRGQAKAAICAMCHRLGAQGTPFGPNLTGWGAVRATEQILKDIVFPSEHLAHGFDQPVRLSSGNGKIIAEGFASNYSYHAGSVNVKLFGGQTKKILFRKSGLSLKFMKDHSWMPSATDMGLTDQDLADITAYLKTL